MKDWSIPYGVNRLIECILEMKIMNITPKNTIASCLLYAMNGDTTTKKVQRKACLSFECL